MSTIVRTSSARRAQPRAEARRAGVIRALSLFEARALSLHPISLFAFLGLALIFGMGVYAAFDSPAEHGVGYSTWGVSIFAWFLLLAANQSVLRGRRAEELYAIAPVSPITRTTASLLALAGPVAAVAVLAIVLDVALAVLAPGFSISRGPSPVEGVLVVARSLVLVALMGAVGVAVARWVPHGIAGGLAFIASLQGGESAFHPMSGDVTDPLSAIVWHLAYAVGLTLVVAALALSRHGARAYVIAMAAGGMGLIAGRIVFG